jgi:translation initiation factor IF-2
VPIRIYALAKELNIENKDLVDACNKAGIYGKGSALASLTEDEVVKIKSFLDGAKKAPGKPADEAPAPTRPTLGNVARQAIKVLPKQSAKPLATRMGRGRPGDAGAPADASVGIEASSDDYTLAQGDATVAEPADETTYEADAGAPPVATAEAAEESDQASIGQEADTMLAAADDEHDASDQDSDEDDSRAARDYGRRDYGAAGPGKIKILDKGRKPPLKGKDEPPEKRADKPGDKSRPKKGPVINLPKMPEVKQPKPTAASGERTQKPMIRLSKDAIASAKKGMPGAAGPLDSRLRKGDKGAKTGPLKPGDKSPLEAAPLSEKDGGRRRRGKGPADEPGELSEMGSVRPNRGKLKGGAPPKNKRDRDGDDAGGGRRRTLKRQSGPKRDVAAPRKGNAVLELPCTVRSFSEAAGVPSQRVQGVLLRLGQMVTINQQINPELVELLAAELGVELDIRQPASLEDKLIKQFDAQEDPPELLEPRPPIVTFLGHVDHGKTSLLDAIIGTNVVAGEAGGITQHIRAYSIEKGDRHISFVDTPGHEAFTEMRARGANVTDVAVIVIAADDGIMPQTEEAISHAKAAEVPIVVALNKIDLPGADPTRVMQQLSAVDLLPSEWGGETEVVKTSATKGQGVSELLDTLLLTADIHEFKANPHRPAAGVCLEAEQEEERGVIAKLIVQNGTLNVGDVVVCGTAYGRIKAMHDTLRPRVKLTSAGPSTPVNVTGLDTAPQAGQGFYVLSEIAQAREIAESRGAKSREQQLAGHTVRVSFEEFQKRLAEGKMAGKPEELVKLNLIIRADVRGSIEAIIKELGKLEHPEVEIKVLQASVGGITKADVVLAQASEAVIIGFNVIPDDAARLLADERDIEIRRYDIIYKVADDIKAMLEQRLKPEERVVELGHAIVKQVFNIGRVGAVAGCYVANGVIERGCRIRVNRNQRTIGEYDMESLRRVKDDVKEVSRGMECGIKLAGFNDIKQDDILEAYKIEKVARTL